MKTTVHTTAFAALFTVSLLTTARAADAQPDPFKLNLPGFSTHAGFSTTGKSNLKAGGSVSSTTYDFGVSQAIPFGEKASFDLGLNYGETSLDQSKPNARTPLPKELRSISLDLGYSQEIDDTWSLATVSRIEADIEDSHLKSPRSGRVQYLVAQAGEVLAAGGKVLNLVDLSDVYLTFFLPEAAAGRVAIGAEVHLILDALPQYVIPARVSFVASTAQFTPKTVETASERQKLMFRVRAQIDRALLQKHLAVVKTGVPGVAWLRLDPATPWPENLVLRVPE